MEAAILGLVGLGGHTIANQEKRNDKTTKIHEPTEINTSLVDTSEDNRHIHLLGRPQ